MSRRSQVIQVRVSLEEHRLLHQRAVACGRATSTYMREVALGSVPRARPHQVEQRAVHQLARIGNNLNQLARAANATGRLEVSRRLDEVLAELLAQLRKLA